MSNKNQLLEQIALFRMINRYDFIRTIVSSELRKHTASEQYDVPSNASIINKALIKELENMDPNHPFMQVMELVSLTPDFMIQEALVRYVSVTSSIVDFYRAGRTIFSLSHTLTDLLKDTDCLDEHFDFFSYPYKNFYIHFGTAGIEYPSPNPPENGLLKRPADYKAEVAICTGVLLHIDDKEISIKVFTDKMGVKSEYALLGGSMDQLVILKSENEGSVNDMIQKYVAGEKDRFAEKQKARPLKMFENASRDSGSREEKLKSLFKLIINSMFYLISDKNYITTDYTNVPSQERINLFKKEAKKSKPLAEFELDRIGYIKFNKAGFNLNEFTRNSDVNSGNEKSTHWRRGFWKQQPYGPRLDGLRKLIWIMPTIVRSDRGEVPLGRIYDVD